MNDKNTAIIELAREIVKETESRTGSVESLVFKAHRLAVMTNNANYMEWLNLEKFGYSDKEPDLKYMRMTGRTYNSETKIGYWRSIASQEASIDSAKSEIDVVKSFKPTGTYANLQFSNQLQQIKSLTSQISFYKNICSKVVANIQEFSSTVLFTYSFSKEVNSILDEERKKSNDIIIEKFPNLKNSFEVISNNLGSNNIRDWSAVAGECRSIFIFLANELWPQNVEYVCDGDRIKTNQEKNKLLAYIDKKFIGSPTKRAKAKRLFKTVHEIFEIGGKSKRNLDREEIISIVSSTNTLIYELASYTDLEPITSK